jgi:hypothetical protein
MQLCLHFLQMTIIKTKNRAVHTINTIKKVIKINILINI